MSDKDALDIKNRKAANAPVTGWSDQADSDRSHLRLVEEAMEFEQILPAVPVQRQKPTIRVLVIDDDSDDCEITCELLDRAMDTHFEIQRAANAEEGMRLLAASAFDVCLVDYRLPGSDGLCFARLVQSSGYRLPTILMSGMPDEGTEFEALEIGLADYLDKEELDVGRLERRIRFALARESGMGRLGYLGQFDELTGLANRTLLNDRLERALAGSRRHRLRTAIIVVDLNKFKPINDQHGHAAGDYVLRSMANRIMAGLRETDTVARIGGDEFALILENLYRPEDAAIVAKKVISNIIPPVKYKGEYLEVTAALGVAIYPDDGEDAEQLIRNADAAMYRAKRETKACCRFHNTRLDRKVADGRLLECDLQDAIESDQLHIEFLPQEAMQPGMSGYSAVVSWPHPELGTLTIDSFRLLAEQSGLVDPLTKWIIDRSIAELAERYSAGGSKIHISVPILSQQQLDWSEIALSTAAKLDAASLDRDCIELEIDENLLLDELGTGGKAFAALRESGLRVAASDYGISVGSLSLLRDVPLHTLKLSSTLLRGTPSDERRTLFVDAIVKLGNQLGYRLVAEGVSGAEQRAMLRKAGMHAILPRFHTA